jgi:hypothetical protein
MVFRIFQFIGWRQKGLTVYINTQQLTPSPLEQAVVIVWQIWPLSEHNNSRGLCKATENIGASFLPSSPRCRHTLHPTFPLTIRAILRPLNRAYINARVFLSPSLHRPKCQIKIMAAAYVSTFEEATGLAQNFTWRINYRFSQTQNFTWRPNYRFCQTPDRKMHETKPVQFT